VDASSHAYSTRAASTTNPVIMEPNTIYNVEATNDVYIQMLCPATGVFVAYLTAGYKAGDTVEFAVYMTNVMGSGYLAYLYSYGEYDGSYGNVATFTCLNGLMASGFNCNGC